MQNIVTISITASITIVFIVMSAFLSETDNTHKQMRKLQKTCAELGLYVESETNPVCIDPVTRYMYEPKIDN